MSDIEVNPEDIQSEEEEEKIEPMEVKVVNKELRESSPYDGHDDDEHDDMKVTIEEIKEFEDGDSR